MNEQKLNKEIGYLKRNLKLYVDKLKVDIKSSKVKFTKIDVTKIENNYSIIDNSKFLNEKHNSKLRFLDDNKNIEMNRDLNNFNKIEEFHNFKKNLDNEIKIGSNYNNIIDTEMIKNINDDNENNTNLQSYTPISTIDNIEIHEYSKMNTTTNNENNSEITNVTNCKLQNLNNNKNINKDQNKHLSGNSNIINKQRNNSDNNPDKTKYIHYSNNNETNFNNESKNIFIKSINTKNGYSINEQKQLSPKNILDVYNKNLNKANSNSGGHINFSNNMGPPKKKLSISTINEQKFHTNKINTSELTGITQNTNNNSRKSLVKEIRKINSFRQSGTKGKFDYFYKNL